MASGPTARGPIKVEVKPADISVQEPDKTVIDSLQLVNAFIVQSVDTWQRLAASFTVVPTDAVRVTADGKVVIADAEFTSLVKEFLANPAGGASTNVSVVCANGSCPEELVV
ncbi:hypothetical protein [Rhodococcus koreensis]|uniref:Uncharacterized protein n=1 Tax=Rhodococcus koreensis TaxID=99653 RepID=A0A1H4I6Z6_9NOCA|nr:hypothetical protein [Rhodococcus koreensis]SEB29138.1 hypothetical protein SAMN04490239_0026 [Rhodococcus koreensis]